MLPRADPNGTRRRFQPRAGERDLTFGLAEVLALAGGPPRAGDFAREGALARSGVLVVAGTRPLAAGLPGALLPGLVLRAGAAACSSGFSR